jgi:hypothetical protein
MIVFDLVCANDHVFEGWFASSVDYEEQRSRGLVACPLCGDTEVGKAVMAPNVTAKGNSGKSVVPVRSDNAPKPAPAEMKAMLAAIAKAQAKLLEGSEHVGRRFATEARAIHVGDAPERPIHGHATIKEAKALVEEGVPVAPLPLPVVPPEISH